LGSAGWGISTTFYRPEIEIGKAWGEGKRNGQNRQQSIQGVEDQSGIMNKIEVRFEGAHLRDKED